MVGRVCSSVAECYLSRHVSAANQSYLKSGAGRCISDADDWAERGNRILDLSRHCTEFGGLFARLSGNTVAADQCDNVVKTLGIADGVLGAGRVIIPIEKLLTGKMFWETDEDGTWKRVQHEEAGNVSRDSNGSPILQENGAVLRRSFISITQDILGLAARILSFANWLHGLKVYDLKEHSRRMSDAVMGLWITVIALNILQNISKMTHKQDNDDKIKLGLETACNVVDIAALPFDFGYGMKGHPALAITGLAIRTLSSALFLAKEAAYYKQ